MFTPESKELSRAIICNISHNQAQSSSTVNSTIDFSQLHQQSEMQLQFKSPVHFLLFDLRKYEIRKITVY